MLWAVKGPTKLQLGVCSLLLAIAFATQQVVLPAGQDARMALDPLLTQVVRLGKHKFYAGRTERQKLVQRVMVHKPQHCAL